MARPLIVLSGILACFKIDTASRRRTAMLAGPWPIRFRQSSSRHVTSRLQWHWFSMPQCPRIASANAAAVPVRLLM